MGEGASRAKIVGAGMAIIVLGAAVWLLTRHEREPVLPDDSRNMLANPGFELGEKGWEWLSWSKGWAPFEISTGRRHQGQRSVLLPVRSAGDPRRTIVWGVVQEVVLGEQFPECMEGWYLVSRWKRGAPKQYLQAVIISDVKTPKGADQQIRMIITGMDVPSYNLTNARYFFADPDKPVTPPLETWVHFDLEPAKWFAEAWGALPPAGTRLRVFYEARFDDRGPDDEVIAEVYFDDVYLGPRARGHCEDGR